jgi:2-dehydro-3-deoxyphosphogluconate aldolase/(4S)-4-hydroxy-2-oxoglutarate aldolase
MNKRRTLDRIRETGIIAVVRAASGDEAIGVIDALREGGIDVLEVTMTIPGAIPILESVVKRYGDAVTVGVGTVLDAETARACILAGAAFVVSPIVDRSTIESCLTYGVPVIPGAATPTEIVAAWRAGADMVKVFPCSALGGASYIRALKGPLPQIDLVPSGGVSLAMLADFVRAGAAAIGAGGELADVSKVRAGNAAAVRETAQRYLESVRAARRQMRETSSS